jgi:hypothetical protein
MSSYYWLTSYWWRSLLGSSAKKWFAFTMHLDPCVPLPGRNGNLTALLDAGATWPAWLAELCSWIASCWSCCWTCPVLTSAFLGCEDEPAPGGDGVATTGAWRWTSGAWCSSGTGLDGPEGTLGPTLPPTCPPRYGCGIPPLGRGPPRPW